MRAWAAALILLTTSMPSHAHDVWGHGEPIPAWVSKACCGPADAHHLLPDQVHRVEGGYVIDGYPRVIFDAQATPSEDGEYWAFYSEFTDADGAKGFTSVYCFFVPTSG